MCVLLGVFEDHLELVGDCWCRLAFRLVLPPPLLLPLLLCLLRRALLHAQFCKLAATVGCRRDGSCLDFA